MEPVSIMPKIAQKVRVGNTQDGSVPRNRRGTPGKQTTGLMQKKKQFQDLIVARSIVCLLLEGYFHEKSGLPRTRPPAL